MSQLEASWALGQAAGVGATAVFYRGQQLALQRGAGRPAPLLGAPLLGQGEGAAPRAIALLAAALAAAHLHRPVIALAAAPTPAAS